MAVTLKNQPQKRLTLTKTHRSKRKCRTQTQFIGEVKKQSVVTEDQYLEPMVVSETKQGDDWDQ